MDAQAPLRARDDERLVTALNCPVKPPDNEVPLRMRPLDFVDNGIQLPRMRSPDNEIRGLAPRRIRLRAPDNVVLLRARDRMPSSAPNKKNEDPVIKGALLSSVEKMIDDAKKLRGSVQPSAPCIFKVPDKLRELKASAYTPRVVSIGPLHKDDEHLRKDMEGHKKSYMHSLFLRARSSDETVEADVKKVANDCVDAMLGIVDRARACYDASHGLCDKDDVEFAKMLTLDGCFLLELLYKYKKKEFGGDPIFSNVLQLLDIKHDLVLLENQIPFSVLEVLFECTLKQIEGNPSSLTDLVLNFFESLNIVKDIQMKEKHTPTINRHILGLLHTCYRPSSAQQENNNPRDQPPSAQLENNIIKHSATELDRAGVNFVAYRRKKTSVTGVGEDYLDLEFNTSCCFDWLCRTRAPSEIPTYRVYDSTRSRRCCCFSWFCQQFGRSRFGIPKLCIFDDTETFLRNLIAFEQCCPDIEQRHITSYAYLMDTLINTKEDVDLLADAGVIENNLGASEDASDLFNNLCKEVDLGKFFFFSQWKRVDDYYKRPWPRYLASLRRNYFSNPWSGISVIVALILFALTVVQTAYSVHSST
ncbi:hypothetical protein RJ640_007142 [Escallonia rubra]|uniref:Uncharacterized protein n=1 Tax=Escallonia rubra TaxID=112253 RepID=A0AA88U8D1_9ASTE|nr:hypothetical protein RJ640_007142 [Escallonia rubra]